MQHTKIRRECTQVPKKTLNSRKWRARAVSLPIVSVLVDLKKNVPDRKDGKIQFRPSPQSKKNRKKVFTSALFPININIPLSNGELHDPRNQPMENSQKIEAPNNFVMDTKTAEKRRRIATEILETENTYVAALKTVDTNFIKPLKRSEQITTQLPILPPEKRRIIFSNWKRILLFHEGLLGQWRERMESWNDQSKIGDVFDETRMRSFVNLYQRFINNYSTAFHILKETKINSGIFKDFLRKSEQKSSGRLVLEDYLIMPVQRIPRYVLLIDQLLRLTPPLHPDFNSLLFSFEQLKLVADVVNARKKQYDDESEVKKLLSEIQDCPTQQLLQTSTLSVLKWGILKSLTKDKSKPNLYVVLLNKYLILATIKNEKKKIFQFSEVVPLLNSQAYVTKSGEGPFIVFKPPQQSKLQTYQLTHENIEELLSWHQEIVSAITILMTTVQDETPKVVKVDARIEIINNFIQQETLYVHTLKKLQESVTDISDRTLGEFFNSISPIYSGHNGMLAKFFERMAEYEKNNQFGDIFETYLKNLITAYKRYCILWVDIEVGFIKMKENDMHLASRVIQFESSYGDSIEKFLESIDQHLPDLYIVIQELQKNTKKNQFPEEFETLNHISEQLRNFANNILVLKEFNSDNQRQKAKSDSPKIEGKLRSGKSVTETLRFGLLKSGKKVG